MSGNQAFLAQLFYDGRPREVKGYQELRHARARATLYMNEGERYSTLRGRHGVKLFEANFDSLTLTQVDERGTVVPTAPVPGQSTLF